MVTEPSLLLLAGRGLVAISVADDKGERDERSRPVPDRFGLNAEVDL